MVLARGVSSIRALTVASRHVTGDPTRSVAPVTLLLPGVAVVVVAARLPETRLVMVDQFQSAHPLGALPGRVELRPLRHAVDVDRRRLRREREQLLPGP